MQSFAPEASFYGSVLLSTDTCDGDKRKFEETTVLKHRPFVDPWNPSPGEIRAWAYDAESLEPCQDFKLALSWSWHEKALLECASDDRCPKRRYFLDVLYLIVGNAVM